MALTDVKFAARKYKDQHGRLWSAVIDLRANDAIGQWQPSGWTAPWLPEQRADLIRLINDNETGQARLEIDYEKLKAERKYAWDQWVLHRDRLGYALQKDAYDPVHPSASVLHAAGPAPKPVEPVIAAESGDPWILGFEKEMPPWAIPFFTAEAADETKFMRDAEARVKRGQKPKKLEHALAGV